MRGAQQDAGIWDSEASREYAQALADCINNYRSPEQYHVTAEECYDIFSDPQQLRAAIVVSHLYQRFTRCSPQGSITWKAEKHLISNEDTAHSSPAWP